jgi:hypothetical protein
VSITHRGVCPVGHLVDSFVHSVICNCLLAKHVEMPMLNARSGMILLTKKSLAGEDNSSYGIDMAGSHQASAIFIRFGRRSVVSKHRYDKLPIKTMQR